MPAERRFPAARADSQALIQSHYLDGEPSGAWISKDPGSSSPLSAANGCSRSGFPIASLIKLAFGQHDKLLNPEAP